MKSDVIDPSVLVEVFSSYSEKELKQWGVQGFKTLEVQIEDMPTIEWTCTYCGKRLGGFAIVTQLMLGYDGIDYCRKCSAKRAKEELSATCRSVLQTRAK